MFKKRLLAFGLAGVMVMGLNMSVLAAAPGDDLTHESKTSSSNVEFKVPESYTVAIPAKITAGDLTAPTVISTEITSSLINVEPSASVNVKVGAIAVEMTRTNDTGTQVSIPLSVGGKNLTGTDTPIATFSGTTVNTITDFALGVVSGVATQAGTYTGTINFVISSTTD